MTHTSDRTTAKSLAKHQVKLSLMTDGVASSGAPFHIVPVPEKRNGTGPRRSEISSF